MALRAGRFSKNARLEQASNNKPSMKQGEKGEAVAIVQQALVDLGFAMPNTTNNGRSLADGIFGSETVRVVSQFQAANRIAVDGRVGRDTLAKLDELILAQSAQKEAKSRLLSRNEFTLRTAKPQS
jgi:peptidoglycan hydrolase-like protein with peptidoglycan-binding domain